MGQKEILQACVFSVEPTPIVLSGKPGGGKTSLATAIADTFGIPGVVLNPSTKGDGIFGTIPFIKAGSHGDRVTFPVHEWADFFAGGYGIIVIDELTTKPHLLPELTGLLLDGDIGSFRFPKMVRRVATMNPPECSVNGVPLPGPTANRMMHLEWKSFGHKQHAAYLRSKLAKRGEEESQTLDYHAMMKRVEDNWAPNYAKAVTLASKFHDQNDGKFLHNMPDPSDPKLSGPWPSDRTWDMATSFLASAFLHGLSEEDQEAGVAGLIGPDAASTWFAYQQEFAGMPTVEDFLSGKSDFKHNPHRLDKTAYLVEMASTTLSDTSTPDRVNKANFLWKFLDEVSGDSRDIVVVPAQTLVTSKLDTACPNSYPVIRKLHGILTMKA
jgi:hypothetical protein